MTKFLSKCFVDNSTLQGREVGEIWFSLFLDKSRFWLKAWQRRSMFSERFTMVIFEKRESLTLR